MTSQRKAMKLEIVPQPTRNWLDLPSELMANILHRVGVVDILQSAQKVCTAWREICKDPAMWRVVYMDASSDPNSKIPLDVMCKHVVDRSKGQLVDITIVKFGDNEILEYIANRSSQLKRLTIRFCEDNMYEAWGESLKKFPLLVELSLYETFISEEGIETAGRYCPMLKTLKVNQGESSFWGGECEDWNIDSDGELIFDEEDYDNDDMALAALGQHLFDSYFNDDIAMAIGRHLHELTHLELIWQPISNKGVEMILDGCHHLESLNMQWCLFIELVGDLRKRCLRQIKCVKGTYDFSC